MPKTYIEKRNEKQAIADWLCNRLNSRGRDATINRWGHVEYTDNSGVVHRFKTKERVVREEVACVHEATSFCKEKTSWVRIRSLSVAKILAHINSEASTQNNKRKEK